MVPTTPTTDPEARHRFATGRAYAEQRSSIELSDLEAEFDHYLRLIGKFHPITPRSRILEIGAGTGWFEVLCAQRGLQCEGIELSPLNVDAARALAERHGVEVDIRVADVESADLGRAAYDVVFATSVFEHVEHYGRAFAKVYEALRPGGVLYLYAPSKFAIRSGEFPGIPLYSWLPYRLRRRIRIARQGPGIVTSAGMDFNEFTYWHLRRHLASLGFARVVDRIDFLDRDDLASSAPGKGLALGLVKAVAPLRAAARLFAGGHTLICVK